MQKINLFLIIIAFLNLTYADNIDYRVTSSFEECYFSLDIIAYKNDSNYKIIYDPTQDIYEIYIYKSNSEFARFIIPMKPYGICIYLNDGQRFNMGERALSIVPLELRYDFYNEYYMNTVAKSNIVINPNTDITIYNLEDSIIANYININNSTWDIYINGTLNIVGNDINWLHPIMLSFKLIDDHFRDKDNYIGYVDYNCPKNKTNYYYLIIIIIVIASAAVFIALSYIMLYICNKKRQYQIIN